MSSKVMNAPLSFAWFIMGSSVYVKLAFEYNIYGVRKESMINLLSNLLSSLGCPKKPKSPNFGMSLTPVVFIG